MSIEPMAEDRFWALIGATAGFGADSEKQLAALRASLDALSADEVAAFKAAFDQQMDRAYSWDLWGAAFLIGGGCSDDSFTDFRYGLIALGREVFEAALADPDNLAGSELLPDFFEEFGSVAAGVWEGKTGRDADEMPLDYTHREEPFGTRFEDDAPAMARRYPRLWERVGANY